MRIDAVVTKAYQYTLTNAILESVGPAGFARVAMVGGGA